MLIYTEKNTPRLQYIAEVFFGEYTVTTSPVAFHQAAGPKINYSHKRFSDEEFHVKPSGLLHEESIRKQAITISRWNDLDIFFKTNGDIPFDVFSASFYLLTRYEEYLPHQKDSYGRFAHTESLAYRSGFLDRPLVNVWMNVFTGLLQHKFKTFVAPKRSFQFIPTYDIDIAFAGGRGWLRSLYSLVKHETTSINGRDIFDVYDWLNSLHKKYHLYPLYFFLLARRRSKYDKNLSPGSKRLQRLIRTIASDYLTGLHPSWQSYHDELALKDEVKMLEKITNDKVTRSRQHYVQFTLPHTYRKLADAGIVHEYSMGYGSINGFRASYAAPFYWYDLMHEKQTSLLIHPFCYMDANSFFEQKLSAEEAGKELRYYFDAVKSVDGEFITIFHNHFLTEESQWQPWRDMYRGFLEEQSVSDKTTTSPSQQQQ